MTAKQNKNNFFIQNPKEMQSKERLKVVKRWAESVDTAEKIKSYMEFFGVNKLCAANELLQVGVDLQEKYAHRWATRIERKALARKKKSRVKNKENLETPSFELENDFYYVAGYTEGGAPYGITFEELS